MYICTTYVFQIKYSLQKTCTYEVLLYDFIISFYQRKQPLTAVKAAVCRCSFKICVLKNFAIFTGKDLCWSLFLIN